MITELLNILSWKSKSPTVVFLVDDFGAVKANKEIVENNYFGHARIDLKNRFNIFDTLSSVKDFTKLFEVLEKNTSKLGSTPVFTLVTSMANPDFERIIQSGEYQFLEFWDSIKNYGGENLVKCWKEGIEKGYISPELHGREHLNFKRFMKIINESPDLKEIFFQHNCLPELSFTNPSHDYLSAFDFDEPSDIEEQKKVVKSSIEIFEKSFHRKPELFVAPALKYNKALNKTLVENEVRAVDKARKSIEPLGNGKYGKSFNYTGKKIYKNQLSVLSRNVMFEPSMTTKSNWVNFAYFKIEECFRSNVPAIISSHRVNYVGGVSEVNRENGLWALDELLTKINETYSEVSYLSASELIQKMHAK